jgi:hypothetical protein
MTLLTIRKMKTKKIRLICQVKKIKSKEKANIQMRLDSKFKTVFQITLFLSLAMIE